MTSLAGQSTIDQLRADLEGRVVVPGDADYDAARTVFPGDIDRRPAAIARPISASEVAGVVSLARESGLDLAVRGGGHSGAGHGVCDDGIVLDLRALRGLDVDPARRTASAGAGLTAGDYTEALSEHGLVTGFGDAATVGIGGITLGGGVGYLSRAQGMTVDNLLAAEIVTADGEIREIDADNHPDLFWAIRGGGGNFGVVTRFRFRLHELDTVVGGMMILPATPGTIRGFVAAAEDAPEQLSTIANVMPAPPLPFLPSEHHGRLVVMAMLCWAGSVENGNRALEPFRALATPIADMVRPIPYTGIYPPEEEDFHPTAVIRTMFLDGVDAGAAETIIDRLESSDAAMRVVQLRVLGGAIARVPSDATAFAHRDARVMANVASLYEGAGDKPGREAWVEEFAGRLRRDDGAAYVNFLGAEGPDRVRAAYPDATWERLTKVKGEYDPSNLFRLNQNIPPA